MVAHFNGFFNFFECKMIDLFLFDRSIRHFDHFFSQNLHFSSQDVRQDFPYFFTLSCNFIADVPDMLYYIYVFTGNN